LILPKTSCIFTNAFLIGLIIGAAGAAISATLEVRSDDIFFAARALALITACTLASYDDNVCIETSKVTAVIIATDGSYVAR
jgi:hypothetical protein